MQSARVARIENTVTAEGYKENDADDTCVTNLGSETRARKMESLHELIFWFERPATERHEKIGVRGLGDPMPIKEHIRLVEDNLV